MSRRPRRRVALAAAGLVGCSLSWASPAPAFAAEEALCGAEVLPDTERLADTTVTRNVAAERMHIPQAWEITRGAGQRVAVIDSGVQPGLGIPQAGQTAIPGLSPMLLSGHGTLAASLIAGPKGVAPEAQVIDVRVYDTDQADVSQGEKDISSEGIAAGIRQAIALHRTTPFGVANISLAVGGDDPTLKQAIKDLMALDVVVVASAGNAEETADGFEGTEDNDAELYPADYRGVLAVSAVAPDNASAVGLVLPNADTDVAAPTFGAIAINANGQVCDFQQVATSWAAAEVSGVVALLRARYPRENAKQIVARLMATTEGSDEATNPWTGAGVVQAHDALTRALNPRRNGRIDRSVSSNESNAEPPPPPSDIDLFGSSRALLLWGGLGGGALMALAVMVRPLTRRD